MPHDDPPKKLQARADIGARLVSLRKVLELTQQAFADRFGLPVSVVRDWEQGRRQPDQAAVVLLEVIRAYPHKVAYAVRRARRGEGAFARLTPRTPPAPETEQDPGPRHAG